MPSRLHETLVTLFQNCPTLAPGLLHTHLAIPSFTETRVESADLTDVQPAEYRADLVVVLRNETLPVLGIIVEVQLSSDPHKHLSWPAYATNLRKRLGCPTCVFVFSPHDSVARWAANPFSSALARSSVRWRSAPTPCRASSILSRLSASPSSLCSP